jgi:hypothetical protein
MQHSESGVSEIISAVLAVLLVIALAAVVGAIFLGWAVPLQKTAYIATQCSPVNITNASAVQLFLSQGETVSLAPATAYGLPVRFSLTNGSATYNFVPLPGTASQGWKPGTSLILFRNASGFWVTDSISSVKNNAGFSNGTWAVNIIDANSKVLIAQHTVTLTGSGAPAPSPVYPGFTAEAWVKWNVPPNPGSDTTSMWAMIVVDGDNDSNRVFQIGHNQFNTKFEFRIVTASTTYNPWGGMIQSDIQPHAGEWYHVAEVYNQTPGTFNIYVNGVKQVGTGVWSTDSSGMHSSTGTVQTGGPSGIYYNWASNQRKFNGDIRGLKTYDRAMVPDEVASRFAAGLPVS